ncbi:c-type cytochrome [Thiobacillus sp.]
MKRFLMGVLTTLVIGVALGVVTVYSGMFDVAADTPHSRFVYHLIETVRDQSIKRHARDLAVPANLADTERIRRGAGNYAAMCAACHLAPGRADSEIRMGLYPKPPDLTHPEEEAVADMAARHFWIIKHGIKASGMAAWSRGGIEDEGIWDLVAFIQKMPSLSVGQYVSLVESSEGHTHGGLPGMETMHTGDGHMPSLENTERHEHSHSGGHDH